MVALNRTIWDRLGEGEDLLFRELVPILSDENRFARSVKRLVEASYEKSLRLFPDIEEAILPHRENESGGPSRREKSKDPMQFYLDEVKSFGVSNREEELLLARALELTRQVARREILGGPRAAKEKELFEQEFGKADPFVRELIAGLGNGKAARARTHSRISFDEKLERVRRRIGEFGRVRALLVSRNLHLVPRFARRFRNLGVANADLIQEGNASLLRAADKFDWRRGVRFSTYAQWWINQALLKSIYSQSRVVRLPVYLNQKMKKIRDRSREQRAKTGFDPTEEEISRQMHEPVNRIRRALRAGAGTYSIDRTVDSNGDVSYRDLLVDRKTAGVEDGPEGIVLTQKITEILDLLPEKERKILVLRFGLEGEAPHTLEEVSKLFKVSRERIRQLQVQATKKLLRPSREQRLGSFLPD